MTTRILIHERLEPGLGMISRELQRRALDDEVKSLQILVGGWIGIGQGVVGLRILKGAPFVIANGPKKSLVGNSDLIEQHPGCGTRGCDLRGRIIYRDGAGVAFASGARGAAEARAEFLERPRLVGDVVQDANALATEHVARDIRYGARNICGAVA